MNVRKSLVALGLVASVGAPLSALAEGIWITTNDEPGSRIVQPAAAKVAGSAALAAVNPTQPGDISPDRQYVFVGGDGGWQIRPMEYRFENGRLVHVDDPVGHMHRVANAGPLSERERTALERSGGN